MTQEARDRRGLWLVVIFALGLGLRWSMMSLGPYHSDCLLLAVQSQKIILTGKMHYLQSSGLPLTALTGALFVAIFNAADDLDRAVRAVNTMSVVFGSLSIWLVYLCAARMRDKATALLAALFSALNPFLIGMATFGNSHVLALFFLIASLYFLQRYADSGRRLDLIWAGCTLGAAGAARIQDLVAMVIPVTLLMVWQRHRLSQRRDPVYFVLPWIIAVVMVVGAYLPKFVGGTDGEGGVDQLIQSHLLAYIDPMSVAGYVTMFQQLMGTFSPVEWVLMSSGLVILVAHREYRTVALLLIWILIPMFVFGQLAFFVYRFLLLTVVALVIAEAVAVAEFFRRRKWFGTAVLSVALIGILWNAAPYYRMFQYRHHNALLVDFFRWVKGITEENAYVIERDHSAWVTYYARRQFMGVDRSSEHGVAAFQTQVDALLEQGTPVYITKYGLLDRTDIFRRALIDHYRLEFVGSRMIEDWHLGCLRQVIVPNDLLRIRAREN